MQIKEILRFLKYEDIKITFYGEETDEITGFSSMYKYKDKTITWCKKLELLSRAGAHDIQLIILPEKANRDFKNYIITENPKKVFFKIVERFFDNSKIQPGICKDSYVSPNVNIGKNVTIGHNCSIDGDITIGDNTIIYKNVSIINKVKIGEGCIIQSFSSIGHDDFAYTEDEYGRKSMIKHYGGVTVGKNVFIGNGCVINRGTIDDTIVGDGTKIDAQCHISHNAYIGENNALVSGTKIYGSVKTGKNVYIASAIVRNQLEIGDNVIIGMGSVVLKNVEDDTTVIGIPAVPFKK